MAMPEGMVVILSDSDDDTNAAAFGPKASQLFVALKQELAASTDNEVVDRQKGKSMLRTNV